MGVDSKKESSEEREEDTEDGEEESEDMRDVFFRVKQKDLHVTEGVLGGSDVWCKRSRRWRRE